MGAEQGRVDSAGEGPGGLLRGGDARFRLWKMSMIFQVGRSRCPWQKFLGGQMPRTRVSVAHSSSNTPSMQ